jgi:hypothetical protein
MNGSRAWFQKNATQNMNVNMSRLPVLAHTGHYSGTKPNNTNIDKNGNKAFVVGKSVIGDEEVVG